VRVFLNWAGVGPVIIKLGGPVAPNARPFIAQLTVRTGIATDTSTRLVNPQLMNVVYSFNSRSTD
jgi:hypothetical protein